MRDCLRVFASSWLTYVDDRQASNLVGVEGTVRTERRSGGFLQLAFCDLFEMRGGAIRRLISYLMEVKT